MIKLPVKSARQIRKDWIRDNIDVGKLNEFENKDVDFVINSMLEAKIMVRSNNFTMVPRSTMSLIRELKEEKRVKE